MPILVQRDVFREWNKTKAAAIPAAAFCELCLLHFVEWVHSSCGGQNKEIWCRQLILQDLYGPSRNKRKGIFSSKDSSVIQQIEGQLASRPLPLWSVACRVSSGYSLTNKLQYNCLLGNSCFSVSIAEWLMARGWGKNLEISLESRFQWFTILNGLLNSKIIFFIDVCSISQLNAMYPGY